METTALTGRGHARCGSLAYAAFPADIRVTFNAAGDDFRIIDHVIKAVAKLMKQLRIPPGWGSAVMGGIKVIPSL
jgi:hypothetical protein